MPDTDPDPFDPHFFGRSPTQSPSGTIEPVEGEGDPTGSEAITEEQFITVTSSLSSFYDFYTAFEPRKFPERGVVRHSTLIGDIKLLEALREHLIQVVSQRAIEAIQAIQEKSAVLVRGGLEQPKLIALRDISPDEARAEILELFRASNAPLYYSGIAEQLRLPLDQVYEACQRLLHEGLIGKGEEQSPETRG